MIKKDLTKLTEMKKEESRKVTNYGKLGVFVCGGDENTMRYVNAKTKEFTLVGHEINIVNIPTSTSEDEALRIFLELQEWSDYVVIQEPNKFSEMLNKLVDKSKDIETIGIDPTTQSVLDILDFWDMDRNKTISVLGQGMFGKRIVDALISRGNSVFSMNSRTMMQTHKRSHSDCTVVVYGKGDFHPINNEKIIDISFNVVHNPELFYYYTPMIGGSGRLTTLNLLIKFNELMSNRVGVSYE